MKVRYKNIVNVKKDKMVKASAKDVQVAETEEAVEEAEETVEAVIVAEIVATRVKIIKTQLVARLKVMEIKVKKEEDPAVDVVEAKENLADKKSRRPKIRGQTLVGTDVDVVALKVIVLQLIVVTVHMVVVEAKAVVVEEAEVAEAKEVQDLAGEVEEVEVVIVHTMGKVTEKTVVDIVEDTVVMIEAVEGVKVEDVVEEEDAVAVTEAIAVVRVSLVHLNEDHKHGATEKVATNTQASNISMNNVNANFFLWLELDLLCG